jgi:hypothetical protein
MLVVLYLVIDVIEELKVSCLILCYQCHRGLVMLVVLYFVIDAIEDL